MSTPTYDAAQLEQSWFFDWNPANNPSPPPITAQCETIGINWRRPPATGPDPIGPFFLQIFTSFHISPFTIPIGDGFNYQLTIPFSPGTRYQICMFDSAGNTGGCQGVYTVYANPRIPAPTCANFTEPTQLAVKTTTSQTGWPAQCSFLEFTGLQGTPPYTFIAAPSLRPPTIIKNIGGEGIRWQIPYGHASPFFVGLTDSTGRAWGWGPLHAGDGPDTSCLDYKHTIAEKNRVPIGSIIGGVMGALVLGVLIGLAIMSLWNRYRKREPNTFVPSMMLQPAKGSSTLLHPTPFIQPELAYVESNRPQAAAGGDTTRSPGQLSDGETCYENDRQSATAGQSGHGISGQPSQFSFSTGAQSPSTSPKDSRYSAAVDSSGRRTSNASGLGLMSPDGSRLIDPRDAITKTKESYTSQSSSPPSQPQSPPPPPSSRNNQVYVIHQDSGRAPVSIITDNATRVVELPPQYLDGIHVQGQGDNYGNRMSQTSISQPRY